MEERWYTWGFRYEDRRAPKDENYRRAAYLPIPCDDDSPLIDLLEYWQLPNDWDVTRDREGLELVAKIRHSRQRGGKRTQCGITQYYLITSAQTLF